MAGTRRKHGAEDRHSRGAGSRLLEEAQTLQQRGERRKGEEAAAAFKQAAAKFREALAVGLESDEAEDARFGVAECLQLWGDAHAYAVAHLPDAQLSAALERQANGEACSLYSQAEAAYEQVTLRGQPLRADAAVNCGNTLAAHAELLLERRDAVAATAAGAAAAAAAKASGADAGATATTSGADERGAASAEAAMLLERASKLYRQALQLEDDALTWSNLGDVLVQFGEVLCGNGMQPLGQSAFQSGMEAYECACSMSDTTAGDDLPGLLCNWAAGELTVAQQPQTALADRARLLDSAAARLQQALDFDRGDPEPATTLGDVLVARAELLQASTASAAGQGDACDAGSSSSLQPAQQPGAPGNSGGAVAAAYVTAIQRGYDQALSLNRSHTPALVSKAEALFALGKVHAQRQDMPSASQTFEDCCITYETALRSPPAVGGFSARCSARYNLACAAAAAAVCRQQCPAGSTGAAACQPASGATADAVASAREAQAQELLSLLLACGGTNKAEMAADDDLRPVWSRAWFIQMAAPSGR